MWQNIKNRYFVRHWFPHCSYCALLAVVVVADRLRGFRVEVFDGTTWAKEWPAGGGSKTALPKKVAVTLVDERGETYRREVPIRLAGQEGNVTWSGRRNVGNR